LPGVHLELIWAVLAVYSSLHLEYILACKNTPSRTVRVKGQKKTR
jgi:hypothetical protein